MSYRRNTPATGRRRLNELASALGRDPWIDVRQHRVVQYPPTSWTTLAQQLGDEAGVAVSHQTLINGYGRRVKQELDRLVEA